MAQQKDNRIFKVLLAVLLLALIGLGVWSYSTYQENEGIKVALKDEKAQIQKELENISTEYSIEIDKGNALNADLVDARDRITRLVDSVGKLETDVRVLSRMRAELSNIRKERDLLQDRINTLEIVNQNLSKVNDSTLSALNSEILKNQDKNSTIENMNANMARAAALVPTNFEPVGIIVRSSGKQIENDRARRVDDIKVCFTLPENPLASTGVTSFYLQVINPDNNVLGLNKKQVFDGQELTYSKIVQFNYKGKELDLCEVVDANEDNIIKGRYRVNLYNGPIRVSSNEITLR
ncbi:hypothetical protein LY01_00720 [Nonlabens xylanidelens]|uniref:Uncharacterized protein n=1 Tax=Nonlabens xylanidelens TaxID=191564 RepID=A0A2S6IRW3_9FLAO|nr:hypothetical protein [Nonlabens xylanidelens]PPK96895.1 hypothetical protein LY01_00720 [Nonlabens xylanidelens]PQJ13593.1 hypothetical protein BST94_14670 [Nonlabens xylanidelens]